MEKYSKHLEQLVNERTAELESEKERATTLLYSESVHSHSLTRHSLTIQE